MKKLFLLAALLLGISVCANASVNREDPPKTPKWEVSDQCRETNVSYDANSGSVTIKGSKNEGYKATVRRENGSIDQWNDSDTRRSDRLHSNSRKEGNVDRGNPTAVKVDCWGKEADQNK